MKITWQAIRAALIGENMALGLSEGEAKTTAQAMMNHSLEMLVNGFGSKIGTEEYGLAQAEIQRIRVSLAENGGRQQGAA